MVCAANWPRCSIYIGGKSLHMSHVPHQVGAYPGFSGMKRLGVFLLPLGWNTSLSQGYPQH